MASGDVLVTSRADTSAIGSIILTAVHLEVDRPPAAGSRHRPHAAWPAPRRRAMLGSLSPEGFGLAWRRRV